LTGTGSRTWLDRLLRPGAADQHAVVVDLCWLTGLCLLLMGVGLGLRDPWPADEPRFALIARDMLRSGDWLVPRVGGDLYPDKPPFYFWLLTLVVINGQNASAGPIHRWTVLQFGPVARWPIWVQTLLPLLTGAAAWLAGYPLLVRIGIIDPAQSPGNLAGQALVVGAAIYLSLKYLLPVVLLLHLISSYVFLGNNPFWEFVGTTARRIVAPLNRVSLRVGRVDFTPLIALTTLLLMLNAIPITRWVCREYFPKSTLQRELNRWVLWPR